MRVIAVILAAGAGRRIGGPKALLRIGQTTFLAHLARTLARPGVAGVVAVLGHGARRVEDEAGLSSEVALVVNPRPDEGMLGSVIAGLKVAEARGVDAILLHPVDHPLVTPATVDEVVAALGRGAFVAVPAYGGRRGHPGGFARASWAALRDAAPARGARAVLADHPEWVEHVPGDEGCVAGINSPEDYERRIGFFRKPRGGTR